MYRLGRTLVPTRWILQRLNSRTLIGDLSPRCVYQDGTLDLPTRTNRDGSVMLSHSTLGGLLAADSQFKRSRTVTPLASPRSEIFTAPVELNEATNKAMWLRLAATDLNAEILER